MSTVTNLFNLSTENRIVPFGRSTFVLKFVNESNTRQFLNRIQELAQAGDADGSVDITFLIAYADLHAFGLNPFFSSEFQGQLVKNLRVKIRYIVTDEQGCFHSFVPSNLRYGVKYLRKLSRKVA